MEKNTSQLLVIDGGLVKTSADGIVEGLGIVFGSEQEPDQSKEKDFFTTDSFIQKKHRFSVPLFYEHGLGANEEQIGEAILTKANDGWHAQAEIDLTSDSGKMVYEAVKDKPHGFSTGALQHMVRREAKDNGTNFLKKWVVGELSLTARPAERKAVVQAVKSIDGEAVYEEAFPTEEDQNSATVVAIYGEDGNKLWTPGADNFPDASVAKSIEIKHTSGSVSYSLYNYNEDSEVGTEVSVVEWGDPASVLAHIQNVMSKVAIATKADMTPEEKDFDERVTSIVKSMLKDAPDSEVEEIKTQLVEKDNEITELRTQLAERDQAATIAEQKIAQLQILADAQGTINKYKGK